MSTIGYWRMKKLWLFACFIPARWQCYVFASHQQAFAFDKWERDVHTAWIAFIWRMITIDGHMRQFACYPINEPFGEHCYASVIVCHFFATQSSCRTQAHDQWSWHRTRTHTTFLAATALLRFQAHTWLTTHIQCTHALRAVDFMSAYRHEIDIQFVDIDWYFADGLCRICMQKYFSCTTNLADLLNRLTYADLVVDNHYRYKTGLWPQRLFKFTQIDNSIFFDWQVGYAKTLGFQITTWVQDTLVFLWKIKRINWPKVYRFWLATQLIGSRTLTICVVIIWFFLSL